MINEGGSKKGIRRNQKAGGRNNVPQGLKPGEFYALTRPSKGRSSTVIQCAVALPAFWTRTVTRMEVVRTTCTKGSAT
jgi:hypothetical protein